VHAFSEMRKKLTRSVKIIIAALLISTKIFVALDMMKVVHPCNRLTFGFDARKIILEMTLF